MCDVPLFISFPPPPIPIRCCLCPNSRWTCPVHDCRLVLCYTFAIPCVVRCLSCCVITWRFYSKLNQLCSTTFVSEIVCVQGVDIAQTKRCPGLSYGCRHRRAIGHVGLCPIVQAERSFRVCQVHKHACTRDCSRSRTLTYIFKVRRDLFVIIFIQILFSVLFYTCISVCVRAHSLAGSHISVRSIHHRRRFPSGRHIVFLLLLRPTNLHHFWG